MKTLKYIISSFIILFVLVGIFSSSAIAYLTDTNVAFTVREKENINRDNTGYYLIFTDNGVYQNIDTVWYWKFDSSDVYNELEIGKKYNAHVYGFRVPFMSWYKNIIDVTPYQ